jgi:hypothetical protein
MRNLLYAATALAAVIALPVAAANATTILTFGQSATANTVTGTSNATGTHVSGTDIAVTITQIDAPLVTPINAFLDFSANSTSGATTGLAVVQHFIGTFSVNGLANNTGTNYLQGSFSDGIFGIRGLTGLTLTADGIFTSAVITDLSPPRDFSLSFTNVTPAVGTNGAQASNSANCAPFTTLACNDTGQTIQSFTASVSGNASAAAAPEPASLALLGVGLLGLGFVANRKRSV